MKKYIVRQAPGHGIVGDSNSLAEAIAIAVKLSDPQTKGECSYWIEKSGDENCPVLYDNEITEPGAYLLLMELINKDPVIRPPLDPTGRMI